METSTKIWYHGRCDRACHRATKHWHLATDAYRDDLTGRPRLASVEIVGHGGKYNNLLSVGELISRLQQCPADARISMEGQELYALTDTQLATVLSSYAPEHESFDHTHQFLGVQR